MNRQIDNFRILILLSIATLGLAIYVSFHAEPPPAELQDLYGWRGYGAIGMALLHAPVVARFRKTAPPS